MTNARTTRPISSVNAIVDALSVLGIRHIDTPYRVWQAIADAGARVTQLSTP
jgi:hypothetical protein